MPVPTSGPDRETRHHLPGYVEQKDGILRRLRRIEGQVRGLRRMVEQGTYRIDVLTQVSATAAPRPTALDLLDEHLGCCVSEAVGRGGDQAKEKVGGASRVIARLVRS